jgi:DnaK suppressor protein
MSRGSIVKKVAPTKAASGKSAASKTATKSAARSVSKAASSKVAAKAATKPPTKPPTKPATKSAIKAPTRSASRPATKPVQAKAAPAKPVAKTVAKAVAKATAAAPSRKSERRIAGLTEAELLRAPADRYMDAGQMAYFRECLMEMRNEILEKADATSEHLREHEIEPDPTDQATIEEEYALELRARDRERKLLKKIEQALARISDGSYGYCEETGEVIGIPRLLARPTATLSVEAQTRRELKQKLYGD